MYERGMQKMKATKIIREILAEKNMRISVLAKMVGQDRRIVDKRIRQDGITIDSLDKLAKALGYKIVIMPIEKRLPEGAYEVEQ